jgi:putative NADH-flavin reductase
VKKVLIIGASGSLATEVIDAIKHEQLTLFVRNKNKLSNKLSNGHTVVEGDAMKFDSVKKAIAGQDVVYVNLAGNLEAMTRNIVNAMNEPASEELSR